MEVTGNALVFLISRACPLKCSFCCLPPDGHKLSVQEMSRWVREIKEKLPHLVSNIAFSGGEPFLFFEEMLEVARVASECGFPFTAITSAHWARSYAVAYKRLSKLKSFGLGRLNLSADPDHQRTVPLEYVKNALQAAVDLDLHGDVVGTFYDLNNSVAKHLGQAPPPRYKFLEKLIAPFGRAKELCLDLSLYQNQIEGLEKLRCYREVGHDIVVYPHGKVLPCCSTANTENPLIFGCLRNGDNVSDIVHKICSSFLMRIIKRESFGELRKITLKYFPESKKLWPDHRKVHGPCSYCVKVFSNTRLRGMIMKALIEEEPHYLARFIEKHARVL